MSEGKRVKKGPIELLQKAYTEHEFMRIVKYDDDSIARKSSGVSIGGSASNWKEGEFYYWPQWRLAGTNYEALISYAMMEGGLQDVTGYKRGKQTLGPFIGRNGTNNSYEAGSFMLNVNITSVSKGRFEVLESPEYDTDLKIPKYKLTVDEDKKGEKLATVTPGKSFRGSAAEFITHEREAHKKLVEKHKSEIDTKANLDALAKLRLKGFPSKSGKTTKSGSKEKKEISFENFVANFEARAAKQAKNSKKGYKASSYWWNISALTHDLAGSRLIPNANLKGNYIRIGDTRFIFTVKSSKDEYNGPLWYFRFKNGWINPVEGEEEPDNSKAIKDAKKELKSVVENEDNILTLTKKGKDAQSEGETNKRKKNKEKTPEEEEEEEEEEGEEGEEEEEGED